MKTEIELRKIESSKKFKNLINKSNSFFREKEKLQKEKLQKEELKRLNKNLPLLNISKEIEIAKKNMNYNLDKALNMLKN
jgi:hypothetical protein